MLTCAALLPVFRSQANRRAGRAPPVCAQRQLYSGHGPGINYNRPDLFEPGRTDGEATPGAHCKIYLLFFKFALLDTR